MRALKGVVATALREHDFPVRKPVSFSVVRPPDSRLRQFKLFENVLKTSNLGTFYDLVTSALYGGEILGDSPVSLPYFNSGEPFYADIIDHDSRTVRESKACNSTHTLVLKDRQRAGYLELQAGNPDYRVNFSVYRHGVSGIVSYKGDEHRLYSDLSKQTAFSVVLPVSVVEALGSIRKDGDGVYLVSHCEGGGDVPPSMRVSSRLVNLLFSDPASALTKLGLDSGRYGINRYRTHGGMNIKRLEREGDSSSERVYFVNSFPVVEVVDNNHAEWVKRLGDEMMAREGCSDWAIEEPTEKDSNYSSPKPEETIFSTLLSP